MERSGWLTRCACVCSSAALRFLRVKNWRRLPFVLWRRSFFPPFLSTNPLPLSITNRGAGTGFPSKVVFAIYIDSLLFVYVTSMFHFGVGFTANLGVCDGAILLCLLCYITTKVGLCPRCTLARLYFGLLRPC